MTRQASSVMVAVSATECLRPANSPARETKLRFGLFNRRPAPRAWQSSLSDCHGARLVSSQDIRITTDSRVLVLRGDIVIEEFYGPSHIVN